MLALPNSRLNCSLCFFRVSPYILLLKITFPFNSKVFFPSPVIIYKHANLKIVGSQGLLEFLANSNMPFSCRKCKETVVSYLGHNEY